MRRIRNLLSFSGDSNLGIGLGACFVLLIAMLVAIGALGLRQLRGLDRNLAEIVDQEWAKVQMSRRAQSYSNLNSRVTMQVFVIDDQEDLVGTVGLPGLEASMEHVRVLSPHRYHDGRRALVCRSGRAKARRSSMLSSKRSREVLICRSRFFRHACT